MACSQNLGVTRTPRGGESRKNRFQREEEKQVYARSKIAINASVRVLVVVALDKAVSRKRGGPGTRGMSQSSATKLTAMARQRRPRPSGGLFVAQS